LLYNVNKEMKKKKKTLKFIENKEMEHPALAVIYEKYRRHRKPMPPPTTVMKDKRKKSRKKQKEELKMEVK
jgi:hypothetical protein